jgi:2-haloacid dehalogenase
MVYIGEYDPFSSVTHASLTHALTQHLPAYKPSATTITSLLATYNTLTPFPGVEETLSTLTQDPAFSWVIFSNGCHAMLSATIASSQMLRGARFVSVDDVKRFKPDPETYRYLLEQLGREGDPASVVLVSGNPFDVVGAGKVGLETVWVSGGADWCDGLGRPRRVVVGLEEIVDGVKSWWN